MVIGIRFIFFFLIIFPSLLFGEDLIKLVNPNLWQHLLIYDKETQNLELIKCEELRLTPKNNTKLADKFWGIPKFEYPDKFIFSIIHEGRELLHIDKEKADLYIYADSTLIILTKKSTNHDLETYHYQDYTSNNLTIEKEAIHFPITIPQMQTIFFADSLYFSIAGENRSFESLIPAKAKAYSRIPPFFSII